MALAANSDAIVLDFETVSPVNLKTKGLLNYVYNKDFKVLCEEAMPIEGIPFLKHASQLLSQSIIIAHNATFEAEVLHRTGRDIKHHFFICTASLSRLLGGPSSLADCCVYWKLKANKMGEGLALIKYFHNRAITDQALYTKYDTLLRSKLATDHKSKDPELLKAVSYLRSHPDPNDKITYQLNLKKLQVYCKQDVLTTVELAKLLIAKYLETGSMASLFKECAYFNDTLKCNMKTAKLNSKLFQSMVVKSSVEMMKAADKFEDEYRINPRSPKQVINWLKANGANIESVNKKILQTIKPTLSKKCLDFLELREKLNATGPKKLSTIVELSNIKGEVKPNILHFGTMSGRSSSLGINILNFPRSTEEEYNEKNFKLDNINKYLRHLIVPKNKDNFIIGIDYKQIELRMLFYTLRYYDLLEKLYNGHDLYTEFAKNLFNKETVTKEQRFVGKVCMLSIGYGAFPKRLASEIGDFSLLPILNKAHAKFFIRFPEVKQLWSHLAKMVKANNHIRLLNDAYRFIPYKKLTYSAANPDYSFSQASIGSRLTSIYNQSTVREVIVEKKHACLNAGFNLMWDMHDELVFEGKEEDIKPIQKIMEEPVSWLPNFKLQTDVDICKHWR